METSICQGFFFLSVCSSCGLFPIDIHFHAFFVFVVVVVLSQKDDATVYMHE